MRFLLYDVFFLGTAFKIDSQIPESVPGRFRWMAAGTARAGVSVGRVKSVRREVRRPRVEGRTAESDIMAVYIFR